MIVSAHATVLLPRAQSSSWTGCLLALALAAVTALPVRAQGTISRTSSDANGGTIGRVRSDNILRCAAEPRPGFAGVGDDGRITGLAVDLCRAIAIAILGPAGRIELNLVVAESEFVPLRHGAADVALLSGATIAEHRLGPSLLPGPVVFIDPIAVMVPASSPAQSVHDLDGRTVCVLIASPGQRTLEAALATERINVSRLAFAEDVEMLDAYNVGNCEAVVDHATRLAGMRRSAGINHLQSRILAPPLALTPVFAATPVNDGAWAALVSWTVQLLIAADDKPSPWRATAAAPLADLRAGWLTDVQVRLGTYAAMRDRHVGTHSPLGLTAWPNAPWPDGLLPRLIFD